MEVCLFDSHAHYEDKKFDAVRSELMTALPLPGEHSPLGVCGILNCGCDHESTQTCIALAEQYPFVYAAAGIHPHEAGREDIQTLSWLYQALRHPKVVALGEIGLDYHYDFSPRDVQKKVLDIQFQIARETKKPVVIHDREAHGDCMTFVRKYTDVRGVFHSYSGSGEMAKELIKHGWYISYSGSVTFKNAHNLRDSVLSVPLDRILVETDAPYLAPVPHRGKRNDSHLMYATVETLAQLKRMPPLEIAQITCINAKRLFGLQ